MSNVYNNIVVVMYNVRYFMNVQASDAELISIFYMYHQSNVTDSFLFNGTEYRVITKIRI